MRKSLLVIAAVALLSVLVAYGEDPDRVLESNIPFSFKVQSTIFPPGHYRTEEINDIFNTWMIRSADGKHEAIFLTEPMNFPEGARVTGLTFEKVDGQDVLAKIEISGQYEGWKLPLLGPNRQGAGQGTNSAEMHSTTSS